MRDLRRALRRRGWRTPTSAARAVRVLLAPRGERRLRVGERALLVMLGARLFALPMTRCSFDGRPILRAARRRSAEAEPHERRVPRACAVGRGPRSATVAVSDGAAMLSPGELEAVLAHELAHVRTRDVLTQTNAALPGDTPLEPDARRRLPLLGSRLRCLAPIAAASLRISCCRRSARVAADRIAAQLVDPNDLADALVRLDSRRRAGRVQRLAGDGAASGPEPVRPRGEGVADVRDPSARCRADSATPRPRMNGRMPLGSMR